MLFLFFSFFFFFNDTATTEIYTLSLHDALPIRPKWTGGRTRSARPFPTPRFSTCARTDRKSTRLNSSHITISYAVFCLKKKKYTAHDAGEPSIGVNWNSPNSASGVTNFQSDLQTLFINFFFNDTATTEIYTLSLHDALPTSSTCAR